MDGAEHDPLRDLACGELGEDIICLTQRIKHNLPVFVGRFWVWIYNAAETSH